MLEKKVILDFSSNNKKLVKFSEEVEVFVDGEKKKSPILLSSDQIVKVKAKEEIGKREIILRKDGDLKLYGKMVIHSGFEEEPEIIENGEENILLLKKVEKEMPPKLTLDDIIEILSKEGVKLGIINDNVKLLIEDEEEKEFLIVKGIDAINDEEDQVKVLFGDRKKNFTYDNAGKVDYRSFYSVVSVKKGDVIGELVIGQVGKNGLSIYGEKIKRKEKKKLFLKNGYGCKIIENKVVATIDGRPTYKSNTFFVNELFEVSTDIDMKSGNINFPGDVTINGTVKDGMLVESGNIVQIKGGVESSNVKGKGEVRIEENVLGSKVFAGSEDINIRDLILSMKTLKGFLQNIFDSVNLVKDINPRLQNKKDGEIVKVLIETKFNNIPKICMNIITKAALLNMRELKTLSFIKEKLIGLGPLKLDSINSLLLIMEIMDEEIRKLEGIKMISADVYIPYSQDSQISASGYVYITGKGQYVSDIYGEKGVIFEKTGSVCRGGIIKGNDIIKARVVGSPSEVVTKLVVSKGGVIECDIVYPSVIFAFGERSYTFKEACKEVKAFMDKKGEIIVEKLKL